MKRRIYNAFRTTILLLGIGLVLLFSACDGFFADNDLDGKIKAAIEYANAKSYTLLIKSDSQYGEFLSDGEKQCKINNSIDIQFTANSGTYIYKGMEAVNKNNQSVSMNDYVELTETGTEVEHALGIYKINVKLIKESDEILIRPVCLLIPTVNNHIPASTDSQYPTMPIIINFNKPVEFESKEITIDKLFEKEIVSLKYYGQDISAYFETPVFNEQMTMLTLTPKRISYDQNGNPEGKSLYEYIGKQNSAFIEVKVSFGSGIGIKDGETFIPLKQDSNSNFSIYYMKNKEETAPEQYLFFVTKEKIDVQDAQDLKSTEKFTNDSFDLSSASQDLEKIIQNRTNGKIYIFGRYYDKDSGVNLIRVKEKRTNEPFLCAEVFDETEYNQIFSIQDSNVSYSNSSDGYTNFVLEYDLQSLNGAILVSVTVIDGAGNESIPQSITAIKKDFLNLGAWDYYFSNTGFITDEWDFYEPYLDTKYETETQFDLAEYNSTIKKLWFTADFDNENYAYGDGLCCLYGQYFLPTECMTIECEYIHKDGKTYREKLKHNHNNEYGHAYWELDLDVEKIGGTVFNFIISDDMGNTGEFGYQIPESNSIVYTMEKDTNSANVNFFSADGLTIEKNLRVKTSEGNTQTAKFTDKEKIQIESGFDYLVCPCVELNHGHFYLEIPQNLGYSMNSEIQTFSDKVIKDNVQITRSAMTDYLDVTVSISQDNWNIFDAIYTDYSYTAFDYKGDPYTLSKREYFSKESTSVTVRVLNKGLYAENALCQLYGIKNNSLSTATEVTIPKVFGSQYDNIKPKIEKSSFSWDGDYISITVSDDHSDIDSGVVIVNGKSFELSNTVKTVKLYTWDINTTPSSIMELHVNVSDTAGNIATYSEWSGIQWAPVTSIEKNGTKWKLYTKTTRNLSGSVQERNIRVWKLGTDGKWATGTTTKYPTSILSQSNGETVWVINNATLPEDSYVKIREGLSGYSQLTYYYTGAAGTGKYDLLMTNGTSITSVAISSDAPVFAHTMVTDRDYEECKNWSTEEWERYKKYIGDTYMDFSETEHGAQRYSIPVNEINSGECYVVIAHFSDNHTEMSPVFQMP